jgi:hypothetical protein
MEDLAMIKKEYMKPAMRVVKVHTTKMIAISRVSTIGLGEEGLDYDNTGGDQSAAWSRRNRDWDDDEE